MGAGARNRLGLRLEVEGLHKQFVSALAMEQTLADGRERVACLSHDGIAWTERADIIGARLDVSGFTVRLVDRQLDAVLTQALAWQPDVRTWLTAEVSTSDTTFDVMSTAGFAVDDYVHLGTEVVKVTGVSTSPQQLTVTRAQWGTIAQGHVGGLGERLSFPVLTLTRPLSIEGRRCNLHVYSAADDLQGDGSVAFRGVCATDAQLENNGADWRITVDSITRLMDAPVAGDVEDEVGSRGVFYNFSAPVIINVFETSTVSVADQFRLVIPSQDSPRAFFTDNDDFVGYVNGELIAAAQATAGGTGWGNWEVDYVRAVSEGDEGWHLEMRTGATVVKRCVAESVSPIDGYLRQYVDPAGVRVFHTTNLSVSAALLADTVYTIVDDVPYTLGHIPSSIVRRVPRGLHSKSPRGYETISALEMADPTSAPVGRIHLAGTVQVGTLGAVRADWPNGEEGYHEISDQDSTERWIELDGNRTSWVRNPPGPSGYGFGADVRFRFIRTLGTGSLGAIYVTLVTQSPTLANQGGLPFLTAAELTDWTAKAEEAARGRAWALNRIFYADEAISFAEYFAEECKALGVFPILDAGGKLTIERMRAPALTEPGALIITADDVAIDRGFPTWERNVWGRVNQVSYAWGFNPDEGSHSGEIVVRDVQAFSESKMGNTIEAKPRSEPVDGQPTYADLVGLAWPYLGYFGRSYAFVRLEVSFEVLLEQPVQLGQAVDLTLPHVPDARTGTRGLANALGLLVEKGIDLTDGRVTLGVLIHSSEFAGYAPTQRITNVVDNGGGSYTMTVDGVNPDAAALSMNDDALSAHWQVDNAVQLSESNTTTAPSVTGTVTAVDDTLLEITANLSGAPGARDLLHYGAAAAVLDDQVLYAFQADDDARIAFTAEEAAKEYAP